MEPPKAISADKLSGLVVVLLGMICSIIVAVMVKRKVEEINKAAEEAEKKEK